MDVLAVSTNQREDIWNVDPVEGENYHRQMVITRSDKLREVLNVVQDELAKVKFS